MSGICYEHILYNYGQIEKYNQAILFLEGTAIHPFVILP